VIPGTSAVSAWVLALVVAAAPDAAAQVIPDLATVRGEVAFDGRGTPGAFTGRTTRVRGHLVGAANIEGVRGWVEADAASLETGNGRRDRDMRKSLEVDRFPVLRFELDAVGASAATGDSVPVTLRGRFTIHGVTRVTAVRGSVVVRDGRVVFRGRTPLDLTDYDIGGLSKALGLLRMQKEIVVRMELVFAP
jgi:polyisoprenoid-binding protein YceI